MLMSLSLLSLSSSRNEWSLFNAARVTRLHFWEGGFGTWDKEWRRSACATEMNFRMVLTSWGDFCFQKKSPLCKKKHLAWSPEDFCLSSLSSAEFEMGSWFLPSIPHFATANAATLHPMTSSIHGEIDRSKQTEHNRNYTTLSGNEEI